MRQYAPESIAAEYKDSVQVANLSASPISKNFPISADGSKNLLIGVQVSDVTAASGITVALQSSVNPKSNAWRTAKTSSPVSADGWVYLSMNIEVAGDQANLPLGPTGRIVVTTGAGDELTIVDAVVCQRN